MKKKLIAASVLIGGISIVVLSKEICYVPTTPPCPGTATIKGMVCGLDITSAHIYNFVNVSSCGKMNAYSSADGCTYLCPNDDVESEYPEAYPTGSACP